MEHNSQNQLQSRLMKNWCFPLNDRQFGINRSDQWDFLPIAIHGETDLNAIDFKKKNQGHVWS